MEIGVLERVMNVTDFAEITVFPGEKTCAESRGACGGDLIELSTADIMSQSSTGRFMLERCRGGLSLTELGRKG